jgi:lycopene cyclase CruA
MNTVLRIFAFSATPFFSVISTLQPYIMQELLYLEVPHPNTDTVRHWLQYQFLPVTGEKTLTTDGIQLGFRNYTGNHHNTLQIFVWSLQRTTYLKVFRWGDQSVPEEKNILTQLTLELRKQFPQKYPVPPQVNLSQQSIFDALESDYPQTVKFFKQLPAGEYDLNRVYWWEMRWRESVKNPQQPKQVIFTQSGDKNAQPIYDVIYVGGALGIIHAAVMAKLGYKVLLIERLPFGKMNREWNISRDEFQILINLGLFTEAEFESVIAREYVDGFHKFFDGNNPPHLKSPILHTPTVLNIGIDAEKLLRVCGEKFKNAGGEIWDESEFLRADIEDKQVKISIVNLKTKIEKQATGRLLIDAMGTASPIAWQLNNGRAFDSVCPTVGAVISGLDREVWDIKYGDVLNSHGDISRGRQLIWELFPAAENDITIYLFHYHQVHPENPGSLLEMYEDFFTILPEYRRCDLDKLTWKKATFGYIPGHYTVNEKDRQVAFDRLIAIGDAASLQSPLIFTGFGSLVRNLGRLTDLLNTALKHDLLSAKDLNQIRAYQSNVAVTWLFSRGMMVETGKILPPQRINAMLNTFFGILHDAGNQVADTFIKDKIDWMTFNKLALKAAVKNPTLLLWIWEMAGLGDLIKWLGSYWSFTLYGLVSFLLAGWFPQWLENQQGWLESKYPSLWLKLLNLSYTVTSGVGKPNLRQFKL